MVLTVATAAAAPAAAQDGRSDREGTAAARVRDLVYRVRDLEYRWRALDNSERVEQAADQTTVTFAADVFFAFDRADLTPEARSRLEELAGDLTDLGPRTVTIGGHTDGHGDTAYNQDLSVRRARAVEAALDAALGDRFAFEVAGHGETQPVAPNETADGSDNPEGRALNRRVVISYPSD
jgi:outer membrane protein OmpA-like peptidoglycan-associated protein